MRNLELVARARGAFALAPNRLTFTVPAAARAGDVLVLLVDAPLGESETALAGWARQGFGSGNSRAPFLYVRTAGDVPPATVQLVGMAGGGEWLGQLLVLRNADGNLVEQVTLTAFTADNTPNTPGVATAQAISLLVWAWSGAGAVAITPPGGLTLIDTYQQAIVSPRGAAFGYMRANTTGAVNPGPATASGSTTGLGLGIVLRNRAPAIAPELYDPVPGNTGLIATEAP